MNQIPTEWLSYIEDKEYLLLLINPQFIKIDGLIVIQAHFDPKTFSTEWAPIIQKHPNEIERIENTLNHVHLSDFTENVDMQKSIGEYIGNIWREKLISQFPEVPFEISLTLNAREWELGLWKKRE